MPYTEAPAPPSCPLQGTASAPVPWNAKSRLVKRLVQNRLREGRLREGVLNTRAGWVAPRPNLHVCHVDGHGAGDPVCSCFCSVKHREKRLFCYLVCAVSQTVSTIRMAIRMAIARKRARAPAALAQGRSVKARLPSMSCTGGCKQWNKVVYS